MFRPWIGTRFGDPSNMLNGLRLLIVGESHYPGQPHWIGQTYPEQTQETIQADAINEPYRFFKELAHLVTGEPTELWSTERSSAFWHAVAFYNYVPVFIAKPSDGGRPTTEQWHAGKGPFLEVLADTRPDLAIICGLGLWWYVMDALPGGETSNSARRDVAQIGTARGLRIPHPTGSRGEGRYSYVVSRPILETLLE